MCRLFALLLAAFALGVPPSAPASSQYEPRAVCLRTGPGEVTGRLRAIRADRLVLVRNEKEEDLSLRSFREIVFDGPPPHAVPPPFTIWGQGDRLLMVRGISESEEAGALNLAGYGWEGTNVPLASLRALAARGFLRDGPAEELADFERMRHAPPVGFDRLMMTRKGRLRLISCVLTSMTRAGVGIVVGGVQRTVPWSDLAWVVLSPSAQVRAGEGGHTIQLADGSRLRVRSLELQKGTLTGEDGPASYTVSSARLRRIQVASDAYVYLSDLAPESISRQPLLDVVWQPQLDRAITGRPLSLDGKTYPKGIGMHTRTEMTFATEGGYSRFYATIGVDDAAGELGRVVFRVLADGRPLFQSEPLGGADPVQAVALDIGHAHRLTLIADFGSPVESSGNFADWAEARVVK